MDLTTPAAIISAVALVLGLLAYSAVVPDAADRFAPFIVGMLGVMIPAFGIILKKLNDAQATREQTKAAVEQTKEAVEKTHNIVNSQSDKLAAANAELVRTMQASADLRVEEARKAGHAEGLAQGLAAGIALPTPPVENAVKPEERDKEAKP